MEETITWSGLRDRHCEATTSLGKIWIRLDREDRVSGVYTCFGETDKWVPADNESLSLEDGQVQAEFLLAAAKAARKLVEK